MKYDPATRTYNLPRIRGEEATVEVNNDGVLHYITIANEPDYTYRRVLQNGLGNGQNSLQAGFRTGEAARAEHVRRFVVFSKPGTNPGKR